MKKLALALSLVAFSAFATEVDGLVIVFKDGKKSFANKSSQPFVKSTKIAKSMSAIKVDLPKVFNKSGLDLLVKELSLDANVKYVMKNVKLQRRGKAFTPNDAEWLNLWGLKLATESNQSSNAHKAWEEFGTPSKTVLGEEVVVAVVDEGVDVTHPDLKANVFVNPGEVAGDGIDNDGNGYVDDINGYDFTNDSGEIEAGYHGTHVAGTVSAVGNNNEGVIGLSPNTKILSAAGSMYVSTAIEAYDYVYNLKKAYLESNGAKGANIVATNSSFGYDEADCKTSGYKAFNDLYEKLGSVGVLNAAATMNQHLNVDVVGDVPTACETLYMVAVTNIQPDGTINEAAYGVTHIDIAAPGTDIVSTTPGNSYDSLMGTSMATPHVTGTIAYLHTIAGKSFAEAYKKDPAAGALLMRDILLKNVTQTKYLSKFVSTGGRLDVFKAAFEISK